MNSKIIEMNIWSSFGTFSTPFSNIGGLFTYLIPPKTAIIGMIGAIFGYDYKNYKQIEQLFEIQISIQSFFSFNSQKITFNAHYGHDDEKKGIMQNIKEDVLINPCYKLFIKFPKSLKNEELTFLEMIKNNETTYNLYMGRNEFFLNYNFIQEIDTETFRLTRENSEEFFKSKHKVYGTLNKDLIENLQLKEDKDSSKTSSLQWNSKDSVEEEDEENIDKCDKFIEYLISIDNVTTLPSFREYVIKQYPIKRTNFMDFNYIPISFYSMNKNEDCFFTNINMKKNCDMDLFNIGGKKWISLI